MDILYDYISHVIQYEYGQSQLNTCDENFIYQSLSDWSSTKKENKTHLSDKAGSVSDLARMANGKLLFNLNYVRWFMLMSLHICELQITY